MNWNELKIPSFLVPKPRRRSEKGYGDENGDVTDSSQFSWTNSFHNKLVNVAFVQQSDSNVYFLIRV